jgi:hypothetical protein
MGGKTYPLAARMLAGRTSKTLRELPRIRGWGKGNVARRLAPAKFQKVSSFRKNRFFLPKAGKCDFMRNLIWYFTDRKPNRIPHKFPFAQARKGNFAE